MSKEKSCSCLPLIIVTRWEWNSWFHQDSFPLLDTDRDWRPNPQFLNVKLGFLSPIPLKFSKSINRKENGKREKRSKLAWSSILSGAAMGVVGGTSCRPLPEIKGIHQHSSLLSVLTLVSKPLFLPLQPLIINLEPLPQPFSSIFLSPIRVRYPLLAWTGNWPGTTRVL